ncbi:uncharacterized protein LOC111801084 [Cucurbita pepo subsp. pepo]|uniref:uncharacterized protein LOC111801084 n=1 Tax=Cucurbita pepo subsp. pepo TaxID=3664 RepID=UPI000C9D8398|nr:uncharacterized protein LOC111801084 [Cucurbita pepo subsp. pepo]
MAAVLCTHTDAASEMSDPPAGESKSRPVGGTEYSWCRAAPGGTGTTVLGLLLSKPPDLPNLQSTLHSLQNLHPILRSKIHYDPSRRDFSFLTPPSPLLHLQILDLTAAARAIASHPDADDPSVSDFHKILEHEINITTWLDPNYPSYSDTDVMFASVYTINDGQWAVFLRLHTAVCDRTAATALLRELLAAASGENEGGEFEIGDHGEIGLGIEDLIPNGKANKPLWARGLDMLGYSLNSFRLANLEFKDANSPRFSQMIRLKMNSDTTEKLLAGCKLRGIKVCGALAAAGLIATRCSKDLPLYHKEKYGVVTLNDCRSLLNPPLTTHHLGFYHSAILNTHDISAEDTLWEVAKRCYFAFSNAKDNNKHFSDMSDLNFLMCKAIENPGLTPSSSMRTALISVFEDPIFEAFSPAQEYLGLHDYIGCASAHGVGPSIAFFDMIRDGQLDCACVYPFPLFSRDQMNQIVDEMKKILVGAVEVVEG